MVRFDAATLEILQQLGHISNSQNDLLRIVLSIASVQSHGATSTFSPTATAHLDLHGHVDSSAWDGNSSLQQQDAFISYDWLGQQQPESASTTPAASTSVAAARWFGLFANDVSRDLYLDTDVPQGLEGGFLDSLKGQDGEGATTPLQRATEIIDGQPLDGAATDREGFREEDMWQASENISLLDQEQVLFENFLRRICSWVRLHSTVVR